MEKVQFGEKEIRTLDAPSGDPYVSLVDLVEALENVADMLGYPPKTGQLRGISDSLRIRFNLKEKK